MIIHSVAFAVARSKLFSWLPWKQRIVNAHLESLPCSYNDMFEGMYIVLGMSCLNMLDVTTKGTKRFSN